MFGQVSIVTLPSGDKVKAKRPSLITMFSEGIFPAEITAYAMMLYNREITDVKRVIANSAEPSITQSQMFKLMDLFIPHVLVDPKVAETTQVTLNDGIQTGTVQLQDINDDDKNYLFLWGQGLLKDNAKEVLTNEVKADAPAETEKVATFPDQASADSGLARAAVSDQALESPGSGIEQPVSA